MFLLFAIIALMITLAYGGKEISEIPFSQLTFKLIGDRFATYCGYGGTIYLVFKSLQKDRIWPWRWTLPYLGNLALRILSITFCCYGVILFSKDIKGGFFDEIGTTQGLIRTITIIALIIGIIVSPFTSQLKMFKEKKGSKYYKADDEKEDSMADET